MKIRTHKAAAPAWTQPRHLAPAPVLMLCPNSQWWLTRCDLRVGILEKIGLPVALVRAPSNQVAFARDCIAQVSPQVVICHAGAIDGAKLAHLARQNPALRFVFVNHSSQSHLVRSAHSVASNHHATAAALELPNFVYGSPDERNHLAAIHGDHPRLQWIPNPVRLPDRNHAGRPGRDGIMLASRVDPVKNLPQQLMAAALLQRRHGLAVYATVKQSNHHPELDHLAAAYGLKLTIVPWMHWDDWMQFLRAHITLVMQASFTESFNYVALEGMLCGRPVIGSPAIRYLPGTWQGNPDDPAELAAIGEQLLANYRPAADHARTRGTAYAEEMNQSYREWGAKLLETTE